MSWTKTEHEGQVMWEGDGERLREPPCACEPPCDYKVPVTILSYRDRVVYRDGVNPQFLLVVWIIGFVVGLLVATVLR